MNKDYTTVEDLAAQESFQDYCLRTDEVAVTHWEKWIKEHPEKSNLVAQAEQLVNLLALQSNKEELQQEWKHLNTQIIQKRRKQIPFKASWIWSAAAVFVFLIGAFALWNYTSITWQEKQAAFGETISFSLSEGSKISLNSNSSVRYKESWKYSKKREIWLKGEAYFEIKKNKKAFVVHTEKGDIWVLGTSFNVQQRKANLKVVLVEGKVKLSIPNSAPIEMEAGTIISISQNGKIEYRQADIATELAWKENKIAFNKVKIKAIVEQLKTEFNIDLEVKENGLLERKVSATVAEKNPELLLKALAEIYELKIIKIDATTYALE